MGGGELGCSGGGAGLVGGLGIRVGLGGCIGGAVPQSTAQAQPPLQSTSRGYRSSVCPHVLVWEDKLGQLLWKRSGRTQEVWPVPILLPLCALLEGCAQVSSYQARTATPFLWIQSQEQSRCPSPGDLLHKHTELLQINKRALPFLSFLVTGWQNHVLQLCGS